MRWSIKLVRIAGIDVKIHLTFLLLLAWIAIVYYQAGGRDAAVEGLVFVLLIFGCVVLHEFGHALTARAFGIQTPDITLLPIGGVARLQRMPDKPWQELVVALAGPLVNVIIAGALLLYLGRDVDLGTMAHPEDVKVSMVVKLAVINVWLAVFNLIPAFPMDGGRVLRALLAMVMSYSTATQVAASIGQFVAILLGFAGLFLSPLLIFIALFVYLGASQEASMAQMKEMTAGMPVSEAMVTEMTPLSPQATLEDAVKALLRTSQHEFPIVDADGNLQGLLMRNDLIASLRTHGASEPVSTAMRRDVPVVHENDAFETAFQKMQESQCPALPVLDRYGRLTGLVTPENVGEMLMVLGALPKDRVPSWRVRREASVT